MPVNERDQSAQKDRSVSGSLALQNRHVDGDFILVFVRFGRVRVEVAFHDSLVQQIFEVFIVRHGFGNLLYQSDNVDFEDLGLGFGVSVFWPSDRVNLVEHQLVIKRELFEVISRFAPKLVKRFNQNFQRLLPELVQPVFPRLVPQMQKSVIRRRGILLITKAIDLLWLLSRTLAVGKSRGTSEE